MLFCARRTLDAEAALDVMSEAFAQAYRGRRRFRGTTEAEERAWLLTIARRQLARYFQRGERDRRALARLAIELPILGPDEIDEIDRRAGLATLREAVSGELDRLGRDQREALRLRVVDGRDYRGIAVELGISEATARARVSRGLRALAAALEAHPPEELTWPAR